MFKKALYVVFVWLLFSVPAFAGEFNNYDVQVTNNSMNYNLSHSSSRIKIKLSTKHLIIDSANGEGEVVLYAESEDGTVEDISKLAVWESLNEYVAVVCNGKITAIDAGTTIITVKYGEYYEEIEVTVADWKGYYVNSFHDEVSGYDIYNLYPVDWKLSTEILLHDPGQDEWLRLEPDYGYVHRSLKEFPSIYTRTITGYNDYFFQEKDYDPLNNQVIIGREYLKSPDKKWGIYSFENYGADNGSRMDIWFLKNFEDGSIYEWLNQDVWMKYQIKWVHDHSILLCRYSESEKQNVIYSFDPDTMRFSKLVSGILSAYSNENNCILFTRNEPDRKPWIKNLSTGAEQLANDKTIEELFYQNVYYEEPKPIETPPLPPSDLKIENLKAITPTIKIKYEHKFAVGDQEIPLPFSFKRNNQDYMPIRPLMEPLKIEVEIEQTAPWKKEYFLRYQTTRIQLSKDEYLNYTGRLYVTPEVLKKLGLPDFSVGFY